MIRVGAVKFGLTGRRGKNDKVSPSPSGGGVNMGPKNDKEKNKPGRPGGGGTTAPADNVITYNGEPVTYNGETVTYTA